LSEKGLANALVTTNNAVSAADAAHILRWIVKLVNML